MSNYDALLEIKNDKQFVAMCVLLFGFERHPRSKEIDLILHRLDDIENELGIGSVDNSAQWLNSWDTWHMWLIRDNVLNYLRDYSGAIK